MVFASLASTDSNFFKEGCGSSEITTITLGCTLQNAMVLIFNAVPSWTRRGKAEIAVDKTFTVRCLRVSRWLSQCWSERGTLALENKNKTLGNPLRIGHISDDDFAEQASQDKRSLIVSLLVV